MKKLIISGLVTVSILSSVIPVLAEDLMDGAVTEPVTVPADDSSLGVVAEPSVNSDVVSDLPVEEPVKNEPVETTVAPVEKTVAPVEKTVAPVDTTTISHVDVTTVVTTVSEPTTTLDDLTVLLNNTAKLDEVIDNHKNLNKAGVSLTNTGEVKLTSTGKPLVEKEYNKEERIVNDYFAGFSRNITTEEFIDEIAPSVKKALKKRDLFPSVVIAQAILESGGGTSGLSSPPHNNLFGIKGSYKGQSVTMRTSEQTSSGVSYDINAEFRVYKTVEDSITDYADLIENGLEHDKDFYKGVRKSVAKTPEKAAEALQGKYATDVNYANKLKNLIEIYDLKQFDK